MSQTEVERFVNDLGKKRNLLENAKPSAIGLASIVAVGKSHGYNFTLDEAKSYIRCRSRHELISKQLDATVGAKPDSSVAISTGVVQAAGSARSAAEVPTSDVQVAEAHSNFASAVQPVAVVLVVVVAVAA
ncbi:Nif11-like leader peptide family natural product precursor [Bradyrhizobium sp. SSUT18]|uniref:Nif11-like leader peptide family natural product precursor n=1 Tax=Bradyrhizobium sp. SSUT18 TaxID=3040602 RepID=UPI00244872D0|nr:Nif11-like leader peptide family natural product precursor [Bradyrhizobium sp. SSUT18]MDH2399142.1 Nif11-like leader peptide family natural product precursor [Bradyrhizobium sp. SSUT18]